MMAPLKLVDRTISSMLWMFTGISAQTLMTILVTAILARLLSPDQFGHVSASLIVINLTMIFAQSGIGPALVQKSGLTALHIRTGFTFSVLVGVATSVVIYSAAPFAAKMMNIQGMAPILRALSVTFTYQGCSIVAEAMLQKQLKFREIALVRLCSYVIGYGVVGVTLAYLHFGVWALVAGHILQTSIQSVTNMVIQPHPKRFCFHTQSLKQLLWFGGGHTLARIGNYFALFGDKFVAARWLGPAALGLYERSYQFMVMPAVLIGNVLQQVLFPALSQISDDAKLFNAFKKGTVIISLVTMPISVLCFLLAPEIVHVVLGAKWHAAILPFQILATGMYFRTSYKIADSLTPSVGAVYKRAWVQWTYALLVFGGCIAASKWGIVGISAAVLFALFMNYVLMMNLSLKLLSSSWKKYIPIHRNGLATAAVTAVVAVPVATLCRMADHPNSLATLAATLLTVGVVLLGLIRKFPAVFLGEEGQWLIARLQAIFVKKLRARTGETKPVAVAEKIAK